MDSSPFSDSKWTSLSPRFSQHEQNTSRVFSTNQNGNTLQESHQNLKTRKDLRFRLTAARGLGSRPLISSGERHILRVSKTVSENFDLSWNQKDGVSNSSQVETYYSDEETKETEARVVTWHTPKPSSQTSWLARNYRKRKTLDASVDTEANIDSPCKQNGNPSFLTRPFGKIPRINSPLQICRHSGESIAETLMCEEGEILDGESDTEECQKAESKTCDYVIQYREKENEKWSSVKNTDRADQMSWYRSEFDQSTDLIMKSIQQKSKPVSALNCTETVKRKVFMLASELSVNKKKSYSQASAFKDFSTKDSRYKLPRSVETKFSEDRRSRRDSESSYSTWSSRGRDSSSSSEENRCRKRSRKRAGSYSSYSHSSRRSQCSSRRSNHKSSTKLPIHSHSSDRHSKWHKNSTAKKRSKSRHSGSNTRSYSSSSYLKHSSSPVSTCSSSSGSTCSSSSGSSYSSSHSSSSSSSSKGNVRSQRRSGSSSSSHSSSNSSDSTCKGDRMKKTSNDRKEEYKEEDTKWNNLMLKIKKYEKEYQKFSDGEQAVSKELTAQCRKQRSNQPGSKWPERIGSHRPTIGNKTDASTSEKRSSGAASVRSKYKLSDKNKITANGKDKQCYPSNSSSVTYSNQRQHCSGGVGNSCSCAMRCKSSDKRHCGQSSGCNDVHRVSQVDDATPVSGNTDTVNQSNQSSVFVGVPNGKCGSTEFGSGNTGTRSNGRRSGDTGKTPNAMTDSAGIRSNGWSKNTGSWSGGRSGNKGSDSKCHNTSTLLNGKAAKNTVVNSKRLPASYWFSYSPPSPDRSGSASDTSSTISSTSSSESSSSSSSTSTSESELEQELSVSKLKEKDVLKNTDFTLSGKDQDKVNREESSEVRDFDKNKEKLEASEEINRTLTEESLQMKNLCLERVCGYNYSVADHEDVGPDRITEDRVPYTLQTSPTPMGFSILPAPSSETIDIQGLENSSELLSTESEKITDSGIGSDEKKPLHTTCLDERISEMSGDLTNSDEANVQDGEVQPAGDDHQPFESTWNAKVDSLCPYSSSDEELDSAITSAGNDIETTKKPGISFLHVSDGSLLEHSVEKQENFKEFEDIPLNCTAHKKSRESVICTEDSIELEATGLGYVCNNKEEEKKSSVCNSASEDMTPATDLNSFLECLSLQAKDKPGTMNSNIVSLEPCSVDADPVDDSLSKYPSMQSYLDCCHGDDIHTEKDTDSKNSGQAQIACCSHVTSASEVYPSDISNSDIDNGQERDSFVEEKMRSCDLNEELGCATESRSSSNTESLYSSSGSFLDPRIDHSYGVREGLFPTSKQQVQVPRDSKNSGTTEEKISGPVLGIIKKKQAVLEKSFQKDCEVMVLVTKFLISKDPDLQGRLESCLHQCLSELSDHFLESFQDYVKKVQRTKKSMD